MEAEIYSLVFLPSALEIEITLSFLKFDITMPVQTRIKPMTWYVSMGSFKIRIAKMPLKTGIV